MTTLDRILSVRHGEQAVAVRHVPASLDVFDSHFPRFPVLPGVLILADLAEVASLALPAGPWRLAGADRVRYRHFVRPGDVLELDVTITELDETTATGKATARVDGKPVTTVRALRMVRGEK